MKQPSSRSRRRVAEAPTASPANSSRRYDALTRGFVLWLRDLTDEQRAALDEATLIVRAEMGEDEWLTPSNVADTMVGEPGMSAPPSRALDLIESAPLLIASPPQNRRAGLNLLGALEAHVARLRREAAMIGEPAPEPRDYRARD